MKTGMLLACPYLDTQETFRPLYRLGLFKNRRERLRVPHCHISQHLPIDADFGLLQSVDETTVRGAILPGRRVYSRYPQPAKIAPASSSIPIGIPQTVQHGFVRSAK